MYKIRMEDNVISMLVGVQEARYVGRGIKDMLLCTGCISSVQISSYIVLQVIIIIVGRQNTAIVQRRIQVEPHIMPHLV